MIDCREFAPAHNPFPANSTAWHLLGSVRDQWRWWWQRQRLIHHNPELAVLENGFMGIWNGFTFVKC